MTTTSDKFFKQAPEQLVPGSTGFGHEGFNAQGTVQIGAPGAYGEVPIVVAGTWSYATLANLGTLLMQVSERYRDANIEAAQAANQVDNDE